MIYAGVSCRCLLKLLKACVHLWLKPSAQRPYEIRNMNIIYICEPSVHEHYRKWSSSLKLLSRFDYRCKIINYFLEPFTLFFIFFLCCFILTYCLEFDLFLFDFWHLLSSNVLMFNLLSVLFIVYFHLCGSWTLWNATDLQYIRNFDLCVGYSIERSRSDRFIGQHIKCLTRNAINIIMINKNTTFFSSITF